MGRPNSHLLRGGSEHYYLVGLSRQTPVDVIHASNPPDNLWLLPRVLKRVQGFAPHFVFDQHDVAPVLLEDHGWSLWSVPATPMTLASPAG